MICVDASVATKWILPEEYSEQADALSTGSILAGEPVIAPSLLPIEVTNILRQRIRGEQHISLAEATELLERCLAIHVSSASAPGLHREALELADWYQFAAVYDADYVALAQILRCELWTDDRRLLRTLRGKLDFVKWIGDFRSEQR